MTNPCVDTTYLEVDAEGAISPLRRWQAGQRATAQQDAVTFVPANNAAGTVLQTCQVEWTNTTGVAQSVFAEMTQGGTRYQIDSLKHLVIETKWGTSFGAAPADPALTGESRVRGYADLGTTSVSGSTVGIYFLLEDRQPQNSVPIDDVVTLLPGQTFKARAQTRWFTAAWGIDTWSGYGSMVPHRQGQVGLLRLDVFSTPVFP